MGRRKNSFSKAIKHLKSTSIDEKIEMLNEIPTNNTGTIYSVVPNSTTVGFDVTTSETNPDYSTIDFDIDGEDGKDTSGLFDNSGNSKFVSPPGDNSYILGPMSAMYYGWSFSSPTRIGYIRESDRRMVNLASLSVKLTEWDGDPSKFNSYGQLTLEQALWFKDIGKKDGDSTHYGNYRAFYPGPPSGGSDAFGRYLAIIVGIPVATSTTTTTTSHLKAPMDQQASDNFSGILNQLGRGKPLSSIFDPTSTQQKGRLGLNLLRSFTDAPLYQGDFIFKGLSRGVNYLPDFTGASNLKVFGRNVPKIGDWNPLFRSMAGENYASQYFTPDLGTAMKYADGGSVVAIPRTNGVRGWKNWIGSNVSRGFDPSKGVEQLVRTSDTVALRNATRIFDLADDKAVQNLTNLAARGATNSKILRTAGRMIPFANIGLTVADVSTRLSQGDYAGALLGGISGIPGPLGWIGLGSQILYDTVDGKETMDRTYGPILTSMANANSNANQSITSSADRRAARSGSPRNQFGQNIKVTSSTSQQTTEPTTQQTTEPTTQQTTSVPKYQQNRNKLNQQRQQQQLQKQQEISRNKPQSERTFLDVQVPPPRPSGNIETSEAELEISTIELKLAGNRSQYEKNRLNQQLSRAKQRRVQAYDNMNAQHERNVQQWNRESPWRNQSVPPETVDEPENQGSFDDKGNYIPPGYEDAIGTDEIGSSDEPETADEPETSSEKPNRDDYPNTRSGAKKYSDDLKKWKASQSQDPFKNEPKPAVGAEDEDLLAMAKYKSEDEMWDAMIKFIDKQTPKDPNAGGSAFPKGRGMGDRWKGAKLNKNNIQIANRILRGDLLIEQKEEKGIDWDSMGKAMIEMGLPEKKEDFVKEMGVILTLQDEINPQLLSMILLSISGKELSDEQKKWLDSNLVPLIGGYAGGRKELLKKGIKNDKKQMGESRVLSESKKKRILKNIKKPVVIPETKQKSYKVSPGKKSKTNFQGMDKLVGDVKPQKSFKKPQDMWSNGWQGYNYRLSQGKKNIVLEKIGEGKQAWNYMLNHGTTMNAKNLEEFWGKNPDFYSYFFNGKKYRPIRKEQVKGDYIVFLVDEFGTNSSMLQSELNIKLAEEDEKKIIAEYNKLNNNEPISYENDPLFKKVSKRLKKEIDYPDKPAKKGYPNEPPPKLGPDGFHPDFGKRYKYDKLDPISATTMKNAPTGNPEIDANVKKASLKSKVKEEYSDWRNEIGKK